MDERQTRELAELIALRLEQGWDSQAMRLWERALQGGADFDKLEGAIYDARYGKEG